MNKTTFVTAAAIAVAQAVNTREYLAGTMTELVSDALAQTEAEGCGDTPRGQPVAYHGPAEFAPNLRQSLTPGMNLAQTSGASGVAGPTPIEMNFAQSTSKASRIKQAPKPESSTRGNPFNSRGNFAQVSQSDAAHSCTTAMERNKNTFDDYLTIQSGADKYTDINFPWQDALYWKDAGEAGRDMAQIESWIDWKRISDDSFPDHTFWGPGGSVASVNPTDINQGYIGNCWIMAAVSAIAEVPGRVDDFFVTDQLSSNGIYAV